MSPVDTRLLEEVAAFLYREARLADEGHYDDWEALLADEMHYWVPLGPAEGDPADQLSYINDTRARLATRLRQLGTGRRHAQTPRSPMRRVVSNIELLPSGDAPADEVVVGSNFVLYELAAQATHELRVWPGRATHRLRRTDDGFRMTAKWVELVHASQGLPNLTFLI